MSGQSCILLKEKKKKKSTTVMEDSNTELILKIKKIEKNNSWIRQIITNLTLLYMIRLSLLPMSIVGMNVLHKKKNSMKKKNHWTLSTKHTRAQSKSKSDCKVLFQWTLQITLYLRLRK